jgi:hypothetical protein
MRPSPIVPRALIDVCARQSQILAALRSRSPLPADIRAELAEAFQALADGEHPSILRAQVPARNVGQSRLRSRYEQQ